MREIGSSFYIKDNCDFRCNKMRIPINGRKKYTEYYSSCRNAIQVILNQNPMINKVALAPAFTCHAVLQPFLNYEMQVIPYDIKINLCLDVNNVLQVVEKYKPGIFIYHSYFGFDDKESRKIYKYLNAKGIVTIEDRTQNMFSSYGSAKADYTVGSIRKWLETPDGGYLTTNIHELVPYTNEFNELVETEMLAMKKKFRYLFYSEGCDLEYRKDFISCENRLDETNSIYGISSYTKNICSKYNWNRLKEARIENYLVLVNGLCDLDIIDIIYERLDLGVVPFMFPVYIKTDRDRFQSYLAQNKIFATAIWACPREFANSISKTVERIYNQILCFAVDQRYTEDDMKRIVECIRNYREGE